MKQTIRRILLSVCICLIGFIGTALAYWTQQLDAELDITLHQSLTLRVEGLEPPQEDPVPLSGMPVLPEPNGEAAQQAQEPPAAASDNADTPADEPVSPAEDAAPAVPEEQPAQTPPAEEGGNTDSEAAEPGGENEAAAPSDGGGEAPSDAGEGESGTDSGGAGGSDAAPAGGEA